VALPEKNDSYVKENKGRSAQGSAGVPAMNASLLDQFPPETFWPLGNQTSWH
jgi:hypothetical protein